MNVHQKEWIKVEPSHYDDEEIRRVDGIVIHLIVSPYDLPDAVRGEFDEQSKRFVVQLRYLDEEPTTERVADPHVTLTVGQRSGRIYRISLDLEGLGESDIELMISEAVRKLGAERYPTKLEAKQNYEIVRKVLKDKFTLLSPALNEARAY